ncbi:hypothetical protein ACJIZ3_021422 [Penstemon smallii]|uniref:Uncharacterized protein n=1 Tax=Penstemon smallii TaxID=265156 RepID=A0ABD3SM37_9LAMI
MCLNQLSSCEMNSYIVLINLPN